MSDHRDEPVRRPVDYDELFPGRFLKAGLFKGKDVTLTVASVVLEELPTDQGTEKTRGVVSFKETKLQLVLNSTNAQCIAAMFSRKPQAWVGHKITFMPDRDKFGRETVDCIRVKGSPELTADLEIEVRLPRKKPKKRTLFKIATNGAKPADAPPADDAPPPDREPGSDG
jgi:hypothetical protein